MLVPLFSFWYPRGRLPREMIHGSPKQRHNFGGSLRRTRKHNIYIPRDRTESHIPIWKSTPTGKNRGGEIWFSILTFAAYILSYLIFFHPFKRYPRRPIVAISRFSYPFFFFLKKKAQNVAPQTREGGVLAYRPFFLVTNSKPQNLIPTPKSLCLNGSDENPSHAVNRESYMYV